MWNLISMVTTKKIPFKKYTVGNEKRIKMVHYKNLWPIKEGIVERSKKDLRHVENE
jgi:hypothetical protein